jgi:DNA-binding NarL/FixJ family response regulator
MARVFSVAEDLMLASRVDAMLTAAGHHVILARSLQASSALDGAELIVADLDVESPEALVGLGVPVLGYYSHVDAETRRAAVDAGVDLVVPRSRMSRELPQLVEGLLGEGSA